MNIKFFLRSMIFFVGFGMSSGIEAMDSGKRKMGDRSPQHTPDAKRNVYIVPLIVESFLERQPLNSTDIYLLKLWLTGVVMQSGQWHLLSSLSNANGETLAMRIIEDGHLDKREVFCALDKGPLDFRSNEFGKNLFYFIQGVPSRVIRTKLVRALCENLKRFHSIDDIFQQADDDLLMAFIDYLQSRSALNSTDQHARTLLMVALQYNRVNAAFKLIELSAIIDFERRDIRGMTVLRYNQMRQIALPEIDCLTIYLEQLASESRPLIAPRPQRSLAPDIGRLLEQLESSSII